MTQRAAADQVDVPDLEVDADGGPGSSRSIQRVAAILRAIGRSSGSRLTDIALEVNLSKSTVSRFLAGLVGEKLVEQDSSGMFYLGLDLFILGRASANRFSVLDMARESLDRLVERSDDTVYLSVRSDYDAICIDRREGQFPIKVLTLAAGDRRPLGVGAGSLALLAAFPDDEVEQAVKANAQSLAAYANYTPSRVYELVERTRREGYSFNEGNIIPDMYAVGVPVLDGRRRPVAALSIAAITRRLEGERRVSIIQWLQSEAANVEKRLMMVGRNQT